MPFTNWQHETAGNMPNYRRNTNKSPLQGVADFFKEYWMLILGGMFVYPLLVRFFRSSEASDKLAEVNAQHLELEAINANPTTQTGALNAVTNDAAIHQAAKDLFHHLGYKYSWWDPRRWSENDEEAFMAITSVCIAMKVPKELIDAYYIISSGRNLFDDCRESLDKIYFNQLKW